MLQFLRYKALPFLTSLLIIGVVVLALPTPAHAQGVQPWSGVCVGTGDAKDVATIQGFQCILANLLSIAVSGLGLIGFVMMLIGGFTYMLSAGNSKGADTARQTITFAVVGLVVALSAFIILRLIASFTGVSTILNFTIPNSDTTFK
jgi:cbb3-type cytochrome oxidase subunit 3